MGTEAEIRVVTPDGVRVADLPDAQVDRVVWGLNRLHKAEISLDPGSRGASSLSGQLVKRHIQIWLNGVLELWGVPRTIDGNSLRVQIGMEDYREIFQYRNVLNENLVYTDLDMLQIATNLMTYAQSASQGTNADEGITVYPWVASGQLQSRTYTSDRKGSIYEALIEFPTLEGGFDWDCEWLTKQVRLFYPNKGTLRNDLAMEYGRTIVDYTYNETAMKLATLVDATGGTSIVDVWRPYDRAKSRYVHEDVAASNEYGVHIAVLPAGAKSDLKWLERKAKEAVAIRKKSVQVPSIKMIPNKDQYVGQTASPLQVLGNLRVGDSHRLRIDHGLVQVSGIQRVDTMTYTGADDMIEATYTSVIP